MKEVDQWCVLVAADFGRVGAPPSVGLAQCPSKSFAGNNDVQGAAPPLTPAAKPAALPRMSAFHGISLTGMVFLLRALKHCLLGLPIWPVRLFRRSVIDLMGAVLIQAGCSRRRLLYWLTRCECSCSPFEFHYWLKLYCLRLLNCRNRRLQMCGLEPMRCLDTACSCNQSFQPHFACAESAVYCRCVGFWADAMASSIR